MALTLIGLETSSSITVNVGVLPGDFYRVQRQFLLRMNWWMPPLLSLVLLGITQSVASAIGGLAVGLSILAFLPVQQWRSARRRDPTFGERTVFTFTATGIHLEFQTAAVRLDWAALKELRETKDDLLFGLQAGFFYFIPKRELTTADLAGIREFLRNCPPAEKRLRA